MDGLVKGMDAKDFMDLKHTNIKNFYDQLTPSEKKDFEDPNKRLELIKMMPDYKKITDNHEKLVRIAAALKEKVEENHSNYEKNTYESLKNMEDYENAKAMCYDKFNACL